MTFVDSMKASIKSHNHWITWEWEKNKQEKIIYVLFLKKTNNRILVINYHTYEYVFKLDENQNKIIWTKNIVFNKSYNINNNNNNKSSIILLYCSKWNEFQIIIIIKNHE